MDLNVRNIQSYNKEIKNNDESGVSEIYTPTEGMLKVSSKTSVYCCCRR